MHSARVSTYEVLERPAAFDEFVERLRTGLLPVLQTLPGFVSYSLVHAHDRAAVISITVWKSRASADAATTIAAEWSRNNITDLATIRDNFVGDIIALP